MRIGKMIAKDELSWCLKKDFQLVVDEMYRDQWGEFA